MVVDRRAWGAGLGAAAIAAFVIWNLAGGGEQAASRTTPPRASARGANAPVEAPVEVRLDQLSAGKSAPGELRRNPFQFQARAAPNRPAADAPPLSAPPSRAGDAPPAGPPGMPPIDLKFIGVVESGSGMKLAVLTDGRMVSHGQEGDVIEGRYRILKIGVESIEIAHLDGRGSQTIRLTGQ
jgi:hypothetical protein